MKVGMFHEDFKVPPAVRTPGVQEQSSRREMKNLP
jgi:hypothetical protein